MLGQLVVPGGHGGRRRGSAQLGERLALSARDELRRRVRRGRRDRVQLVGLDGALGEDQLTGRGRHIAVLGQHDAVDVLDLVRGDVRRVQDRENEEHRDVEAGGEPHQHRHAPPPMAADRARSPVPSRSAGLLGSVGARGHSVVQGRGRIGSPSGDVCGEGVGPIDAILLVGGQGTRLRPLTLSSPKPMLPVAGVPFLTHQLAQARAAGVTHVVLATSYQPEVFEGHFGDGSALGLELEYVTEVEPMGTGGAIRNVASSLRGGPDDPVVVFNGDVLSGHSLTDAAGAARLDRRRRHAVPHRGGRRPRVRLRAHRRGRAGDRLPGEDARADHQPDQRRVLRLPSLASSTPSRPGGRCRWSGRPSRGCSPPGRG